MSLLALCEIVFFLAFGINHFYPHRVLGIIIPIAAIAIGIVMLLSLTVGMKLS